MLVVKKQRICLFVSAFLILLIGGIVLFSLNKLPKCGELKINGVDITQENVLIYFKRAEIPLIETMEGLGMTVNWIDNSTAYIINEGKKYILSLSEVSLIEYGQNINLLLPPPGGDRSYTILEKEVILDSNTVKSVAYLMGVEINIHISHKEKIVYISFVN